MWEAPYFLHSADEDSEVQGLRRIELEQDGDKERQSQGQSGVKGGEGRRERHREREIRTRRDVRGALTDSERLVAGLCLLPGQWSPVSKLSFPNESWPISL